MGTQGAPKKNGPMTDRNQIMTRARIAQRSGPNHGKVTNDV
jgi:hypothetical protein